MNLLISYVEHVLYECTNMLYVLCVCRQPDDILLKNNM